MQRSTYPLLAVLMGVLAFAAGTAPPVDAQGAPTAPAFIQAFPRSGAVLVTWLSVPNPGVGYNVYRRDVGQPAEQAVLANAQPTAFTSFLDTGADGKGLPNGRPFVYFVRSVYLEIGGRVITGPPSHPLVTLRGFAPKLGVSTRLIEGPPSRQVVVTPHAPVLGSLFAYDIETLNPGSVAVDGSVLTFRASGADIWDRADGQTFLAVPVAGDFTITMKLLEKPAHAASDGDNSAKVGLQMKFGLTPGEPYALVFASVERSPEYMFEGRRVFGGGMNFSGGKTDFSSAMFPVWLRLTRRGTMLSAQQSFDGTTFEDVFDAQEFANIPSVTYVGVAATAHRDGAYVVGKIDLASLKIEPPR